MKIIFRISLIVTQLLFFYATVQGQLATPNVLSSDMVLQQGREVPVWGTAAPGERIQVSFGGQRMSTRADAEGNWRVDLQPMTASKIPLTMVIKGRQESILFENVLVGEVWLCSGQSNMEYRMKLIPEFLPPAQGEDLAALELEKPANEMIRVFNSPRREDSPVSWNVADGESLVNTSVAGYFFAKSIQEQLDVPVGIITSAIGGTRIESWTTGTAYEKSSVFGEMFKDTDGRIDGDRPGNWYKTMIAPLVPYTVKGFLWYQGENNCGKRDRMYAEKCSVLVDSWREVFEAPEAPFYYVLLAPHIYSDRRHNNKRFAVTAEDLPLFREQQVKAASMVPYSDYVVITDLIDDLTDIHPSYKWEVGARLARLAMAKEYGMPETVWSGPRMNDTEVVADSIIVSFLHVADGLKTNDDKLLNWFEIAAEDGIFHPALAEIKDENKVVVYHPEIRRPSKVRFGWHETAVPNLVNSEGLPAVPFRVR